MNFYHLIQEKVFHTYEDWRMKSPIYDRSGFHITGAPRDAGRTYHVYGDTPAA